MYVFDVRISQSLETIDCDVVEIDSTHDDTDTSRNIRRRSLIGSCQWFKYSCRRISQASYWLIVTRSATRISWLDFNEYDDDFRGWIISINATWTRLIYSFPNSTKYRVEAPNLWVLLLICRPINWILILISSTYYRCLARSVYRFIWILIHTVRKFQDNLSLILFSNWYLSRSWLSITYWRKTCDTVRHDYLILMWDLLFTRCLDFLNLQLERDSLGSENWHLLT